MSSSSSGGVMVMNGNDNHTRMNITTSSHMTPAPALNPHATAFEPVEEEQSRPTELKAGKIYVIATGQGNLRQVSSNHEHNSTATPSPPLPLAMHDHNLTLASPPSPFGRSQRSNSSASIQSMVSGLSMDGSLGGQRLAGGGKKKKGKRERERMKKKAAAEAMVQPNLNSLAQSNHPLLDFESFAPSAATSDYEDGPSLNSVPVTITNSNTVTTRLPSLSSLPPMSLNGMNGRWQGVNEAILSPTSTNTSFSNFSPNSPPNSFQRTSQRHSLDDTLMDQSYDGIQRVSQALQRNSNKLILVTSPSHHPVTSLQRQQDDEYDGHLVHESEHDDSSSQITITPKPPRYPSATSPIIIRPATSSSMNNPTSPSFATSSAASPSTTTLPSTVAAYPTPPQQPPPVFRSPSRSGTRPNSAATNAISGITTTTMASPFVSPGTSPPSHISSTTSSPSTTTVIQISPPIAVSSAISTASSPATTTIASVSTSPETISVGAATSSPTRPPLRHHSSASEMFAETVAAAAASSAQQEEDGHHTPHSNSPSSPSSRSSSPRSLSQSQTESVSFPTIASPYSSFSSRSGQGAMKSGRSGSNASFNAPHRVQSRSFNSVTESVVGTNDGYRTQSPTPSSTQHQSAMRGSFSIKGGGKQRNQPPSSTMTTERNTPNTMTSASSSPAQPTRSTPNRTNNTTTTTPSKPPSSSALTHSPGTSSSLNETRKSIVAYISSPDCNLFSGVAGFFQVTHAHLDTLVQVGRGLASLLSRLRKFDRAGFTFQTMEQLIETVAQVEGRSLSKRRKLILHYLSSAECTLFSGTTELKLTVSDLDAAVEAAGGSIGSLLTYMKRLSHAGATFQSLRQVLPILNVLNETEQQLLCSQQLAMKQQQSAIGFNLNPNHPSNNPPQQLQQLLLQQQQLQNQITLLQQQQTAFQSNANAAAAVAGGYMLSNQYDSMNAAAAAAVMYQQGQQQQNPYLQPMQLSTGTTHSTDVTTAALQSAYLAMGSPLMQPMTPITQADVNQLMLYQTAVQQQQQQQLSSV